MKITKNNLNEVLFENQGARLLIADITTHTGANLYYYHDVEIAVQKALGIWCEAQAADEEEGGFYNISFPDFSKERILLPPGSRRAFSQQYFRGGYLKGLTFGGIHRIW